MMFDVLPGSSVPEMVATDSVWPCSEHHDLAAHVYKGLHELDFEISKAYKNETLWK